MTPVMMIAMMKGACDTLIGKKEDSFLCIIEATIRSCINMCSAAKAIAADDDRLYVSVLCVSEGGKGGLTCGWATWRNQSNIQKRPLDGKLFVLLALPSLCAPPQQQQQRLRASGFLLIAARSRALWMSS